MRAPQLRSVVLILFFSVNSVFVGRVLLGTGFHCVIALISQLLFPFCHRQTFIGIERTVNICHRFRKSSDFSLLITSCHCKNRRNCVRRIAERCVGKRTYARIIRPHMRLRIDCYKISLANPCFHTVHHFLFLLER